MGNRIFHGFDTHAPMHIYRRHLPHWRQDGATYFVTFRLGDSIPRPVLLAWNDADRTWLQAHGIDGSLSDPRWQSVYDALPEQVRESFQRHAARRLHIELDKCHGSCLLRQPEARRVLGEALEHFDGERWWVGDYFAQFWIFNPATRRNSRLLSGVTVSPRDSAFAAAVFVDHDGYAAPLDYAAGVLTIDEAQKSAGPLS